MVMNVAAIQCTSQNAEATTRAAAQAAVQDTLPDVMVAVMGATGTGKSTFINQLTADARIHIGHNPESETFDVQTARYVDKKTGRSVMLIDTPGFDDSRAGVTDTDVLEKIVTFLEPAEGERPKLNGIIYMHRISDPRVGGVSRKNLRLFHSLCGDDNLRNVRIVTTNWSRVGQEEGNNREEALRTGAFKALVDHGATMHRHLNTVQSAQAVIAGLIPLPAVTIQIQLELEQGAKLEETAAGNVLIEGMQAMQKKHEKELASLKKELEEAAKANDLALCAELGEEHKALEDKMTLAEEDKQRLSKTLEQTRPSLAAEKARFRELQRRTEEQSIALQRLHNETEEERLRLEAQIRGIEEKRRLMEHDQQEAMRKNEAVMKQLDRERAEIRAQSDKQSRDLKEAQMKMAEDARRLEAEIKAGNERRRKLEREQREAKDRNDRLMDQLAEDRRLRLAEARKQSDALERERLRMAAEAKRLADQVRADGERRRKLEEEQQKAKRENDLLAQRLATEREQRKQEACAHELALQKKAEEARRRQARYEAKIAKIEEERRRQKDRADRGMFGRYLNDCGEVMNQCIDEAGPVGFVVGLGAAPIVAGWRAIFS